MRGTRITIVAVALLLPLAGCTGRRVVVRPDPATLGSAALPAQFSAIGVRALPDASVHPPAGEPVAGFASAVEKSGMADAVYYPMRPGDSVDAVLDTRIDVTFDENSGSNFAKAFFTGFTMLLLEPFFWYDYDYVLSGQVDVVRPDGSSVRVNAVTTATSAVKFFSLNEERSAEGEALSRGKESLYRQLLTEIQRSSTVAASP